MKTDIVMGVCVVISLLVHKVRLRMTLHTYSVFTIHILIELELLNKMTQSIFNIIVCV